MKCFEKSISNNLIRKEINKYQASRAMIKKNDEQDDAYP